MHFGTRQTNKTDHSSLSLRHRPLCSHRHRHSSRPHHRRHYHADTRPQPFRLGTSFLRRPGCPLDQPAVISRQLHLVSAYRQWQERKCSLRRSPSCLRGRPRCLRLHPGGSRRRHRHHHQPPPVYPTATCRDECPWHHRPVRHLCPSCRPPESITWQEIENKSVRQGTPIRRDKTVRACACVCEREV